MPFEDLLNDTAINGQNLSQLNIQHGDKAGNIGRFLKGAGYAWLG